MSFTNKVISCCTAIFMALIAGHSQAQTNAEVVMYVMDTSGSMTTNMPHQNKNRWEFAVNLARANAKSLSSANSVSGDHVYLQFMEFKGHNNIKLSNVVPLHEYSDEDLDYVLTEFYKAEHRRLLSVQPSGSTALADALCTSFDIMDRMTNAMLTQNLQVNSGYQIPADLNIVDREVNFFSDLGDNDSRRCDVIANPSPSQDPWQSVIDYAAHIQSGYDDGTKPGKFQFHKYMFTNDPINVLAKTAQLQGDTSKSLSQLTSKANRMPVSTIEAMRQLTDIMDGYIHVVPDRSAVYLHSGHEHCYDHGVYMCLE